MQFEDDIQALRRGELDQATLLGRLKAYLRREGSDPSRLRQALEAARSADHITDADYDLLTQCIADVSVSSVAQGTPSSDVAVELDDSMTRLATSVDLEGGNDSGNVDVGSRLRDRFILDEVIGVGGMGTVYRGRDVLKIEAQDRNPYVAIKILNDVFKQRPDAFIVLQREASRQQRLAHPNIATVYDFDRTGGIMFITMEYLDGVSLDHFIKHEIRPKGGLPLDEAMPVIEGMCSALSHAHARSIVHADFKPGNCFITATKQLKVLDFGIARAMKDPARVGDETLFDPRSIGALTPAYASPEMLENSADADPRDDIYALACVCYELLTGRHPFHRIPADQARANHLKPERIKQLSRRQNDAMARALAFDRERRTATVREFLEGLGQSGGRSGGVKAALAVGAGALVVAVAMIAPGILDRWSGDAVIAEIEAGQVEAALVTLDELSRQQYIRVLQEGRIGIQGWFEQRFEELMSRPDAEVDFPAAQALLADGAELYPDSATLRQLSDRFGQRRESYLSQIAQDFERYLAPEFLLPSADGGDLPELLARLAVVDPTNPLLGDSRVAGAYADSVDSALADERYDAARRYLDTGLTLAPADATLADLRDRVAAAEQRLARNAAIARLTEQLESGAAAVRTLADAEALLPVVTDLAAMDPGSTAIPATGADLAARLASETGAASESQRLPEVEDRLQRATPVWTAFAQPQMIAPLAARREELVQRQEELVSLVRQAIREPGMELQDGRSALTLISEVRAIDPDDPRPAALQSELVQARRERAEDHVAAADWPAARAELAALDQVPLSPDQREAVALDLQRIDAAEQRAIAQAEASARLAQAQQQAERERLEQERLRQVAAERAERISDSADQLEQSLAGFDDAAAVASISAVLDRMNALEALQPDHPLLVQARPRLEAAVERAVRNQPDAGAGLELVDTAEELIGPGPLLADLRATLASQLQAERAVQRRAAITAAEARLRAALQGELALVEEGGREAARRALMELAPLLQGDADRLAAARQRFLRAHIRTAERLVADKRFSVAERVLEAVDAQVDGEADAVIGMARQSLVAAREAFREERDRQESRARIEALAQRFTLEVNSGQLTRARQTLADYRALSPEGELAAGEGDRRLAEGYQRIGRQRLDAGNFAGARQLVDAGLEVAPGDDALEKLGRDVERLSLLTDISSWFSGESGEPAERVASLIRRYRQMDPEDYAAQEVAWSASAARHLQSLRHDRDAHNGFLEQARSLLSSPGALADLAPRTEPRPVQRQTAVASLPQRRVEVNDRPAVPSLSSSDLLGRWCADNIEIEFQRGRMVFILDNGQADYPVNGYDVNGDTIHVNWDDRRLGPMVFEFGRFTEARDRMVQLRGRPAAADDWQTYNRNFLRCG